MISGFPEQLGASLLNGLAQAWSGPRAQTFDRCLAGLRQSVPFEGAWWALLKGPVEELTRPVFHLSRSVGLSDELRQTYVEICGGDRFVETVLSHPNHVVRWSGAPGADKPRLRQWIKCNQLAHGAAMCSHEPFSGQTLVFALYRFDGSAAFSTSEATVMRFLLGQSVILWSRSLLEMFNKASNDSLAGVLLANSDGTLLFCGADMAAQLAACGWDEPGHRVPDAWLRFRGAGGRLKMGSSWVMITGDSDGLRAELTSTGKNPPLSTRLLRVAVLSCSGLTAKQIARELNLSPTTVRTYLRDAYNQLGVHNKQELDRALNGLG